MGRSVLLCVWLVACGSAPVHTESRVESGGDGESHGASGGDGGSDAHESESESASESAGAHESAIPSVTFVRGSGHRCAISNGIVTCHGDDQHGALGRGRIDPLDTSEAPVAGIDDAVSLCAARLTTCAVRATGEVWCWGWNVAGQLGSLRTPTGETVYESGTAVRASEIGDAVSCAMGRDLVCALRAGGAVTCWGGHALASLAPGAGVVQIAVGLAHVCALTAEGRVLCWGDLGAAAPAEAPVSMQGPEDVVAIDAGARTTCARTRTGGVWCWGDDAHGQLGARPADVPPDRPAVVPGVSHATDLFVSDVNACARVEDGGVFCWGEQLYGASELASRRPLPIERLRGASVLEEDPPRICAQVSGEHRCTAAARPTPEPGLL